MKTIHLFLYAIGFAILSSALAGCEQDVGDPEEAIIGQWEEIAFGVDEDHINQVEVITGYIEFLPDGEYRIFPNLIDFTYTYQIDGIYLYLHASIPSSDYTYEYKFINRNTLQLKYVQGIIPDIMNFPRVYIYRRIK
jgi:hypothetical protein